MTINSNYIISIFKNYGITPKSVCVALSGGADSVCLLHLLSVSSLKEGFKLSAVHINHNLRGEESVRDEEFCKKLCRDLSIPLSVYSVSVLEKANKGESVELAARRIRYEIFDGIDSEYIATAHNADDCLETFLINFSRGSSIKGLVGIPSVRDRFIRPLIKCSRDDILAYLNENNLDYVTDSSNLTDDYTRNKIRHNVIPELKKIYPEIIAVSARNFENISYDNECLESQAQELYSRVFVQDRGLKTDVLLSAHRAITIRTISMYTATVTGKSANNFHLKKMLEMCEFKSKSEVLFDGFSVFVKKGFLYIEKSEKTSFKVETEIVSTEIYKNLIKVNNLLLKNAIDYDKIVGKLVIRNRNSGDKLRPQGRGISKPVRKLQNEIGLSVDARENAPLAVDDNGIAWGYMIGVDQRMSIDDKTKKVLIFKVYKSKNGGQ